jgi:predicted nucleotidyltransferase
MTPAQAHLVEKAKGHLSKDERIQALWLAGSLGRGKGDEWSDVDLLACCEEGTWAEVSADLQISIAAIAEPLLLNVLFEGHVLNVVAEGWHRFDISIIEPGSLTRHVPESLTELFNRGGVQPTGSAPADYQTSAEAVLPIVEEFLRVLGLTPVALGREEFTLATQGIGLLLGLTLDLMLEENGIGPAERGGALTRYPFLDADQKQELLSVPPIAPARDSVIAVNMALARTFLPRAKRQCEKVGAEWPEAFEQGTLVHLRNHGVEI